MCDDPECEYCSNVPETPNEVNLIKPGEPGEVLCEYGSAFPIRWIDASQVSIVDANGNRVPYPTCNKCGNGMTELIGKSACTWICMECPKES